MGGFVEDVVGGIGDAIGGVVDGVVGVVEDIGSSIDDLVHDIIPGGWAGVGAGALLAMGIVDPTLLGLAEEGALTSEAIAGAGLDAAAVAEGAAAVPASVAAATEAAAASGLSPEIIAMANATTDPIAALNAAAGWTTADTAYLATIGASPALIAAAEGNNAIIAAGGTPGITDAARMPGTTPTTTPTTTPGSTTQVFDDGSTLTTNADGSIAATDTAGNATNTLVSPGGPGQAPVYDAAPGTPGVNNTLGASDPTFWQGVKDYSSALLDSYGLGNMSAGQLAALGAAGLIAAPLLTQLGAKGGGGAPTSAGGSNAKIGPANAPLVQTGMNPGMIPVQPAFHTTNDVQNQFDWGVKPYVATTADLANYNTPQGGATHGWGQQTAPQPFDVNQFIQNTINPQWQAVSAGSSPGLYRPQPYGPAVVAATPVVPAPVALPVENVIAPVVPTPVVV